MVIVLELPHRCRVRASFLVRTGRIFQGFEVLGSARDFPKDRGTRKRSRFSKGPRNSEARMISRGLIFSEECEILEGTTKKEADHPEPAINGQRDLLRQHPSALHLPRLPEPPNHDLTYTRSARASNSPYSTGFCVKWDCVSSSSRNRCTAEGTEMRI